MSTPPAKRTAPSPTSSGSYRLGTRASARERRPTKSRSNTPMARPYPHGPPTTTEEKLFSSFLDSASLAGRELVAADDILVPIFNDIRNGLRICTIGHDKLAPHDTRLLKDSFRTTLAAQIDPDYPTWQADALTKRMQAHNVIASDDGAASAFRNLAIRYSRLWNSPRVTVSHITMNSNVEAQIVAKIAIPRDTLILELGGLMACDHLTPDESTESSTRPRRRRRSASPYKTISVIRRAREQGGPVPKDRLLLGPLRFVNHDCAPNCKLVLFPNTLALGVQSIKDIYEGDEITISYGDDYFPPGTCACARCIPRVKESDISISSLVLPSTRKRRYIDENTQVDWESNEELSEEERPKKKRRANSAPF